MTDPTTPAGRDELRTAAQAVDKRARWNWDRIEDTFYVHEFAWNIATISCGADYTRTSDSERENIERRIARFIAAVDPGTVCKLFDALDDAECEIERQRGDLVIERRRANAAEAALDRVRKYAREQRRMAEALHSIDRPYDALPYDNTATALERIIGDRT